MSIVNNSTNIKQTEELSSPLNPLNTKKTTYINSKCQLSTIPPILNKPKN